MNSMLIITVNFKHNYTNYGMDSFGSLLQSKPKANTEIYGSKYNVHVLAKCK